MRRLRPALDQYSCISQCLYANNRCRNGICLAQTNQEKANSGWCVIFNAPDIDEAKRLLERFTAKYQSKAPTLSAWAGDAIPEGLAVFALPTSHRRRLRTTNALERVNKEIKRRTRVATLFPNAASCERLVSAMEAEAE